MKRHVRLAIAGITILLVAFGVYEFVLGDGEITPDENWRTETVDDSGWVGIDPLIAVDSQGNPHISYYDQGNRDLKYAYFDGSAWQIETVDSEGDVGEESGIAIGKDDNIHICYHSVTAGALKYAKKTGDSWAVEIVDQAPDEYHMVSASIALDDEGRPHIGYEVQRDEDGSEDENLDPGWVKYAFWNGSSWEIEEVTTMGSDVYLALGSDNIPHLSFKKEQNRDGRDRIHYAAREAGKWVVEVADFETKAGGDTGIAVDSHNYPHIVYHDYAKDAIKYVKWDGESWSVQTVASRIGSEEGLKISVDSSDRPHIIYSDTRQETLVYAVWDENSWTKETVSRMGNPSIAIDHLGRIHIAHNQTADGDPKEYCPDYVGPEKEIEILMYSVREGTK